MPKEIIKNFLHSRALRTRHRVPGNAWFHVRSENNGADYAELATGRIWFEGPGLLRDHNVCWPIVTKVATRDNDEEASVSAVVVTLSLKRFA